MAEADEKTTVQLLLLEDFFNISSESTSPVWELMPQALVERVLLFLPPASQARFRSVCRRWRELMTSRAFQADRASIAFKLRRGCKLLACLERVARTPISSAKERFRVCKLVFPGLLLTDRCTRLRRLFSDTLVPLLGVALGRRDCLHAVLVAQPCDGDLAGAAVPVGVTSRVHKRLPGRASRLAATGSGSWHWLPSVGRFHYPGLCDLIPQLLHRLHRLADSSLASPVGLHGFENMALISGGIYSMACDVFGTHQVGGQRYVSTSTPAWRVFKAPLHTPE